MLQILAMQVSSLASTLVVVVVAMAAATAVAHYVDFQFGIDMGISLVASFGPILTIAVSAILYFSHKKTETATTAENLYRELEDTLAGLDEEIFPNDFYNTSIKDRTGGSRAVCFMNRKFSHDSYDSLIYSGRINFLDPPLQQRVQNTFKRIKTHNKYIDMVRDMVERNNGVVPAAAHYYCEWMDDAEKHLQQELPAMLQTLRAHFKLKRRA